MKANYERLHEFFETKQFFSKVDQEQIIDSVVRQLEESKEHMVPPFPKNVELEECVHGKKILFTLFINTDKLRRLPPFVLFKNYTFQQEE